MVVAASPQSSVSRPVADTPRPSLVAWRPQLTSFLVFLALAILHTWPLAARPGYYSRVDNGDYQLNAWAIDWIAYTLPRAPTRLFDANIFHPAHDALAYSEPLILPAILVAPVVWAGGSAVLAFNTALLLGLTLSAWAFGWYCRTVTGSWWAGLVGGSLAVFNAHTLTRLTHVQALHLETLPLVFVGLQAIVTRSRPRDAVWTGLALGSQALTSLYLLVFAAWALIAAACARLFDATQRLRTALLVLLSLVIATAAAWPILIHYAVLAFGENLRRTADDAAGLAATWQAYLYTGARVHYASWSHGFAAADALFPGVVGMLLVVTAIVSRAGDRRLVRMWGAVAAGCVLFSMLPLLPGFGTMHSVLWPLQALRAYGRAGQMALVAAGVLAAFGVLALTGRRSPATARWIGIALLALVNLEAFRAPMAWRPFDGIPAIYDTLASVPQATIVELPLFRRRDIFGNARYMLNATRHHHPIVNGYSGFVPPGYHRIQQAVEAFPDVSALAALHEIGVTHIVVHRDWFPPDRLKQIEASPALRIVSQQGPIAIYRLTTGGVASGP